MKYWKFWQKNSIKAKLPDVSAIVAATAPWKHLITLRNAASSLWADVLSPPSSRVLYTLRSYSSGLPLLTLAAAHMLSHSSLTEFTGTVLSAGSRTRWRWRHIWNGREWIPNIKLSVARVCRIVFWKGLFKESQPCLRDIELGNMEGEKCLLGKIIYENSFHECGQRIKFSLLFLLREITHHLENFQSCFLSPKFTECLQSREHFPLFWQQDIR